MAVNPAKPQREILRHFRQRHLPEQNFDHTKYKYHYEHLGANGSFVYGAQTLGYEVVRGDMPENPDLRDATGRCVLGDVVLMRMPLDVWDQLNQETEIERSRIRGDKSKQELIEEVNDRASALLGQRVNIMFEFRDRDELKTRKES